MSGKTPKLRCRQIDVGDLDTIADLLTIGFPRRPRAYWVRALGLLTLHRPPEGFPQYGYMLESGTRAVGVILLICTWTRDGKAIRCNHSSWCVAPEFRSFAPLLLARALKHPATHINISPSVHTLPTIEALGFRRYCEGAFAAIPVLAPSHGKAKVIRVTDKTGPVNSITEIDRQLLDDHHRFGCLSLWCETQDAGYPCVFRKRYVKHLPMIPAAQLVYGPPIDQLVRSAGPLGRFLASSGIPYMLVPANAAIGALVGKFFSRKFMYYRGPDKPQPVDLAYTELAMFGI